MISLFPMFVLLLTVLTVQAGSPDIKAARVHAQSMVEEAEEMMNHGNQGHVDVMVRHAEAMIKHAKEVIEAIPPDNMHGKEAVARLKQAIDHAEELLPHAEKGHQDAAMAHANKAFAHAK
ncbi:MAG: hypothetical protein L0Y56_03790, partial [Nitrospira sp.]|nr:hypothetical protein [Nitrospira sp.]